MTTERGQDRTSTGDESPSGGIGPDEATAAPDEPPRADGAAAQPSKWRMRLPAILVAIATVLAVVSALTTWVDAQALDTDEWVDVSTELLAEPEVQHAIAVYVVDQLYSQLDLTTQLQDRLPPSLDALAPTLVGALREPATDAVQRLLASDRFQQLWETANRAAHEVMVRVLRDETRPAVDVTNGQIVLDLGVVVRAVGEDLGIPQGVLDRLPESAGRIKILEADQLSKAQSAVTLVDFLSWFLFVVVVALYAAAVYLARGRRITVVRNIGFCLIGAGFTVLMLRRVSARAAVESLVSDPTRKSLARTVIDIGTSLLREIGWTGILYGVVIVLFTSLLGTGRISTSVRRLLAPVLNASPAAVAAVTALLILLVLWWSPGRTGERWVTTLALILLIAAAVVVLRRHTKSEFPDTGFGDAVRALRSPAA